MLQVSDEMKKKNSDIESHFYIRMTEPWLRDFASHGEMKPNRTVIYTKYSSTYRWFYTVSWIQILTEIW